MTQRLGWLLHSRWVLKGDDTMMVVWGVCKGDCTRMAVWGKDQDDDKAETRATTRSLFRKDFAIYIWFTRQRQKWWWRWLLRSPVALAMSLQSRFVVSVWGCVCNNGVIQTRGKPLRPTMKVDYDLQTWQGRPKILLFLIPKVMSLGSHIMKILKN